MNPRSKHPIIQPKNSPANPLATSPTKPLTKHGQACLADEHEWLARTERPKVLQKTTNAAAEGDRSENAEYIYGKKRLREIDKRLRYLDKLLDGAKIIDQESLKSHLVCFGSTVLVTDYEGRKLRWTIVGEGEAEYHQNGVSWKSPVAKALWGKECGETCVIRRPIGELEVEIDEIIFEVKPATLSFDYK